MRQLFKASFALLLTAAMACGGTKSPASAEGELDITVKTISSKAISGGLPVNLTEVMFVICPGRNVTAPRLNDKLVHATLSGLNTASARVTNLAAGTYTVFGYGFDSTNLENDPRNPVEAAAAAFVGPSVTIVVSRAPVLATLALQQNPVMYPPDAIVNLAPFINNVTASAANLESTSAGLTGTVLNLSGNVTFPGLDLLSLVWSDNFGGAFSLVVTPPVNTIGGVTSAVWTPPANREGLAIITLTALSRDLVQSSLTIIVNVTLAGAKGISITATINNWPDVTGMNATNGLILKGGTGSFSGSAVDPDRDVVTFTWSSLCGAFNLTGTFAPDPDPLAAPTPGFSGGQIFTPPAGYTGPCTVTFTASDGKGGSSAGSTVVLVKQPLAFAPEFVILDGPLNASPGSSVQIAFMAIQTFANTTFAELPLTAYVLSGPVGSVFAPISDTSIYDPLTTTVMNWTIPASVCTVAGPRVAYTVVVNATIAATGAPANASDPVPTSVGLIPVSVLCPAI